MFTKTFFYPTLTNHLTQKFNMSVEMTSMFFVVSLFSYGITLKYINLVTNKLGLKMTIATGILLLFISPLLIWPVSILPQSNIVVFIGLVVLGIPGALISLSAICEIINILKTNKMKLDENSANDMASAIYNLSLNLGEALGPTFGGFITEKTNFETSCGYTSIFNLAYLIFFCYISNDVKIQNEEFSSNIKNRLTGDDEYLLDQGRSKNNLLNERSAIGRFRSYSYSNRSSKRTSINTNI